MDNRPHDHSIKIKSFEDGVTIGDWNIWDKSIEGYEYRVIFRDEDNNWVVEIEEFFTDYTHMLNKEQNWMFSNSPCARKNLAHCQQAIFFDKAEVV